MLNTVQIQTVTVVNRWKIVSEKFNNIVKVFFG